MTLSLDPFSAQCAAGYGGTYPSCIACTSGNYNDAPGATTTCDSCGSGTGTWTSPGAATDKSQCGMHDFLTCFEYGTNIPPFR